VIPCLQTSPQRKRKNTRFEELKFHCFPEKGKTQPQKKGIPSKHRNKIFFPFLERNRKQKDADDYTWTSNSMKSMGCLAALLKDIMEFSLIAFILRSVDCKIFIPFPLCPNTKNFGVLNAASLFNSTPAKKNPKPTSRKSKNQSKKLSFWQFTFGETSWAERKRGILRDVVKIRNIRDMNSFKSHNNWLGKENRILEIAVRGQGIGEGFIYLWGGTGTGWMDLHVEYSTLCVIISSWIFQKSSAYFLCLKPFSVYSLCQKFFFLIN